MTKSACPGLLGIFVQATNDLVPNDYNHTHTNGGAT
jgi:hypothetical protein